VKALVSNFMLNLVEYIAVESLTQCRVEWG
jgi:hypothetical protein